MELREARFKANLTQLDVALRAGISQAKISHFERGYLMPKPLEIKALAKALRLRPKDLKFEGGRVVQT